MKLFGGQDMVSPIKKILIKHPQNAYINQSKIETESASLNYLGVPDYEIACSDYNNFLNLISTLDIEVHSLPIYQDTTLDSIYTHDPCVISDKGIILCNMGKKDRVHEPHAVKEYFESINVPILGHIENPGKLEGGDVVWIDTKTLAIGEGYRSNRYGIEQLKTILGDLVEEIITVPLPHWNGKNDCLHLMSNLSPLDHNLFLIYPRLLPVSFVQFLVDRKIELIEVPDSEYNSMGCNVLAVGHRKVIMVDGNPITKNILEKKDLKVFTYNGSEISLKGAGGPTCLTRPFLRTVL
tara:strand:- start:801 stop:1685 length:885 start_codon:yes stop_codon:yes gene_type:complete